jgi:intracellular septation protein
MKFLFDIFPIILFYAAYQLYDIYVATAVAILAAFLQTGLYWLKTRRFENMHLIVLGILIVFGGLTLALHDPIFIMWKPTLVNWLFGLVFLASHFIGKRTIAERMMAKAIRVPAPVWSRVNAAWTLFFLVVGALNIYVAYRFSEEVWVNFKMFGIIGLTLVFVFGQAFYLSRFMDVSEENGQGN